MKGTAAAHPFRGYNLIALRLGFTKQPIRGGEYTKGKR